MEEGAIIQNGISPPDMRATDTCTVKRLESAYTPPGKKKPRGIAWPSA